MKLVIRKEWAVVVVCVSIAVSVFVVEGEVQNPTRVVAFFFEGLRFISGIIGGIFTERALGHDAFRREFHRAAISAYRRISDIRTSVRRMSEEIAVYQAQAEVGGISMLDIVSTRAEEIETSVASSKDDWGDFLSQEMPELGELEQKQEQLKEIRSRAATVDNSDTIEAVAELQSEIKNLATSLPYSLKSLIEVEEEVLPRDGRNSLLVENMLLRSSRDGYLEIIVRTNVGLNEDTIQEISGNAPYGFYFDYAVGSEYFVITDCNHDDVGQVLNPVEGVYYKDYFFTLREFLPPVDPEANPQVGLSEPAELPGSAFEGVVDLADNIISIRFPVGGEPFNDG